MAFLLRPFRNYICELIALETLELRRVAARLERDRHRHEAVSKIINPGEDPATPVRSRQQ